MIKTSRTSVVFITGTFLSHNCWDEWIAYFERNGYACVAPPWPYKNDNPEELRNKHPDGEIASMRLTTLIDYYEDIVQTFPEKPILIGHSLGGLIVQLLMQRNLAKAGIAIHSFPPRGLDIFKFSFLKAWWEPIGFFYSSKKSYLISFKKWKRLIANGMTCEQQKRSYYAYAIPESIHLINDAFSAIAKIEFTNAHAPLLLTSGRFDRLIPASLNYINYKKYNNNDSITDYKEFEDHNHLVFDPSECLEEADFIVYWLEGIMH